MPQPPLPPLNTGGLTLRVIQSGTATTFSDVVFVPYIAGQTWILVEILDYDSKLISVFKNADFDSEGFFGTVSLSPLSYDVAPPVDIRCRRTLIELTANLNRAGFARLSMVRSVQWRVSSLR